MKLHPVGCFSVKYWDARKLLLSSKKSSLFSSPAVLPADELWHLQRCDMDKQLPEMELGRNDGEKTMQEMGEEGGGGGEGVRDADKQQQLDVQWGGAVGGMIALRVHVPKCVYVHVSGCVCVCVWMKLCGHMSICVFAWQRARQCHLAAWQNSSH